MWLAMGTLAIGIICTIVLLRDVTLTWNSELGVELELLPQLDATQAEAMDRARRLVSRLALAIIITVLLLSLTWLGVTLALHRWVLRPIASLRHDVRLATMPGDHSHRIDRVGPLELAELSETAESLRQQLVRELDDANAAREALLQDGPLAAAWSSHMHPEGTLDVDGFRIAAVTQPAHGVIAGDWWHVVALPESRTAVVIGDVAGHGVPAALQCLEARTLIASELRHGATAAQSLSRATQELSEEHFITALVAVLDPQSSTLQYANAGHPPGVVVHPNGEITWLERTGMVMCPLTQSVADASVSFGHGDALLLMTDGLLEAFRADGTEFGPDGLCSAIVATTPRLRLHPDAFLTAVRAEARSQVDEWAADDVTVVAVAHADPVTSSRAGGM